MKKLFSLLLFMSVFTLTQAQNGFNYKALITDNSTALTNQSVNVRFTILENQTTTIYQEEQTTTTDSNGIITILLGEGNVMSGDFTLINWSNSQSLKVEIDTGNGYQDFGTNEFKYVPTAKYAETAGNVPTNLSDLTNDLGFITTETDGDATNELQSLSVNGTQLTISNGNTVTLPTGSGGDQWGSQTVQSNASLTGDGTSVNPLAVDTNSSAFNNWDKNANDDFSGSFNDLTNVPTGLADGDDDTQLTETQVDNFVSNNGYLTTEIDGSTTNELQTISKSGNTVTLSNGGGSFIDTDTDTQLTETQVDNFVSNNGYLTTEIDGSTTNELQSLSVNGTQLTISNGNTVTLPTGSGGDQWGSQTVQSNASLTGDGTSVNPLAVDTNSSTFSNWDKNANDDFSGNFNDLTNVPTGLADGDDDTQLTETQVDNFVANNGYLTTEIDGSTTNELQTISKSGNTVTLSNGGGSFTDTDTDTQLTETQVDNFVANNGYLTTEIDGSTTNELQTISISGNELTISNGNMVTLPEKTYYAGTGIQINPGNVISNTGDADADATNELQTISKSGNTVTLSNGGGSFTDADTQLTETQVDNFVSNNGYLTSETDGDATNELQTLSLSGNVLSISDGNNVTLPSSSGSDVDFLEVGTGQAPDNILDDIYHTGNISIGHATTPNAKLDIKNTGTSTAANSNTGIKITNNNSSNTDKIGVITLLDAAGTAKVYGTKNYLLDNGDGDMYGTHTTIGGLNGDGDHYGNYLYLTGDGTGIHTGSKVLVSAGGTAQQIGNDIEIYTVINANTAVQTGVKIHIHGEGTGDKYGVTNLIDGNADGNLYGTENNISNTNDNTHYGTRNQLQGSGNGTHYGVSNIISGAGQGAQIGVGNIIFNSGNSTHYGVFTTLNGSGSGTHIGTKNHLQGNGTGEQVAVLNEVSNSSDAIHYGVKNMMTGSGSGIHYGSYSELNGAGTGHQTGAYYEINNTGSGVHTGVKAILNGTGTYSQTGLHTEINNTGDGYHYGVLSTIDNSGNGQHTAVSARLSGTGDGVQYGVKSTINNSGVGAHYGTYSELTGTGIGLQYGNKTTIDNSGNSSHFGQHNSLSGSGSGRHYGTYNILSGSGTGLQYASYNKITTTGNGANYASYNYLSGSGSGQKYGVYSRILSSAGGTHYAIYGSALKSGSYAGYFNGDIKTTKELHGSVSGSADMKAYIYGQINEDGTIVTSASSSGFSATRTGVGDYEIHFNTPLSSPTSYTVISNIIDDSPGFATPTQRYSGYFILKTKGTAGGAISKNFTFVVYKK